jgi:hypothetical protein
VGWGEAHTPPNGGAGTTGQIEDAFAALAAVGIGGHNLALCAIEAAGVIDSYRHGEVLALRDTLRTSGGLATPPTPEGGRS